jgi:hypothetical protein
MTRASACRTLQLRSSPSLQHIAGCALQHRPLHKLAACATCINALLQQVQAAVASTQGIQKHHGQRAARLASAISSVSCALVIAAPACKKAIEFSEIQARPAVTAVANSKQPMRRQRIQPATQHIVCKHSGNIKIAGTQRLVEAVLFVAILIRDLRAVPAEVEKQVLLIGNTSIHGVFGHLQSAQNVRQRSSKHMRALNINSIVAAHHMAAKRHPALFEKGCKGHDIIRAPLQRKTGRDHTLVSKTHLNREKLRAGPKLPTNNR